MTDKWIPVKGDFLCPGNILLTADEKGIVIKRGRRALATTEWPGENIRVCELVEDVDTVPVEAIAELLYMATQIVPHAGRAFDIVEAWLDSLKKENRE